MSSVENLDVSLSRGPSLTWRRWPCPFPAKLKFRVEETERPAAALQNSLFTYETPLIKTCRTISRSFRFTGPAQFMLEK